MAKHFTEHNVARRQRGAVLLTSLIMLIILTLLSISMLKSSVFNLKIGGSNQVAIQNLADGEQALIKVINANRALFTPNSTTVQTCNNADCDVKVLPAVQLTNCEQLPNYALGEGPKAVYFELIADVKDPVFEGHTRVHYGIRNVVGSC